VRGSLLLGLLLVTSTASARDLHVGEGEEHADVAAALDAANAGDVVILHEGDYGDVVVEGDDLEVTVADGEQARARTLLIRNASGTTVRGLTISLSFGDPYTRDTMVSVHGSASDVTVSDCTIFSTTDDVTDGWSASDWADLPGTGMSSRAENTTFANNRIRNVGYGISIAHDSPNAWVLGNEIDRFSRDGLRGIGDFGLFENNLVMNAYDVDDHHDDFFQSWSVGEDGRPGTGVVRGVVLRGNTFIGFTDPDRPFAGAAQGVGCFDGFFEDWVVENNVVIVNHWHGITFLGARNLRVVNNTLLDNLRGERPGPPWIQIQAHKDGTPSEDIVVRNNLAETIDVDAQRLTEDHNLRYDDPAALFVDAAGFDLHLRDDADEAIDTGSSEMAPAADRDGVPRPQGAGIDLGAYEWQDGTVEPADAGGPPPPIDAGATRDAGSSRERDASSDAGPDVDEGAGEGGGGCSASGRSTALAPLLALLLLRSRRLG